MKRSKFYGSLMLALAALAASCAPPEEGPTPARLATLRALPSGSFAGRLSDGDTFIAVVMDGDSIRAYVCDGAASTWFEGNALRLPTLLRSADGGELYLRAQGEGLAGSVRRVAVERAFSAARTTASSLFRAEANVGDRRYVGGWIVLPDGAQRGVVFDGEARAASRLTLTGDRAIVVLSGGDRDASRRLEPRRFEPEALRGRTRNRQQFNIAGLGDSFAAGEGAPEVPGAHGDNGEVDVAFPGEHIETWDLRAASRTGAPPYSFQMGSPRAERPSEARLAQMCHRSGANGTRLAAAALHDEWPQAGVSAESFACSGARIGHLVDQNYPGPGGPDQMLESTTDGWLNLPQIAQLQAYEQSSNRVTHAVTLSIGGNDLHFPDIVQACILDPNCADLIPLSIAGFTVPPTVLLQQGVEGFGAEPPIRDKYARLADALDVVVPRDRVLLLEAPTLVERAFPGTNGAVTVACGSVDPLGYDFPTVDAGEVAFIRERVMPTVWGTMRGARAANPHPITGRRWALVSEHVERSRRHGMCAGGDSWFGTLRTGANNQGADIDAGSAGNAALSELSAATSQVVPRRLSGGVCHPNAAGQRDGYGVAITNALRTVLRAHVLPTRPTGLRVAAQTENGDITVRWNDLATTETEYRVKVTRVGADAGAAPEAVLADPNQATEHTVRASGPSTFEVQVRACHVGRGVEECSAFTPPLLVTNFKPTARPDDLGARDGFCNTACTPARMLWNPVNDPAHVYYQVEVDGVPIATTDTFLEVGAASSFRVRSCNLIGCGPASLAHAGPRVVDARGAADVQLAAHCQGARSTARRPGEPTPDPEGLCR